MGIDKEIRFDQNKQFTNQEIVLLTKAVDASISGIIITDNYLPDNPIIYCNAAFERISGYSRSEIIGHNCRFLQARDRDQKARKILREAVKTGTECKVEIRNYRKNGEFFWNELYMSPLKNDRNEVTHFIGVQNDISDRKIIEEQLRVQQKNLENLVVERTKSLQDNQEFLSSIISTVRESLIVLDPEFNVVSANPYFLKTFKVSIEETLGKNFYELGNHQWDIAKLKELLTEILPTNNPVEDFEVEHDFPHIGKKLMLLNAYRIELEGQFKDRILLAIEDITDRREIEQRKDDFLSIASHELKTPLTTIKGYIQALERTVPSESSKKYKEMLTKASIQVNKLNNLIGELLDVSKIQTGNIELHRSSVNIDKIIVEAVDGITSAAACPPIRIEGKANNMVFADESHLIQVLNNLISNAVKYGADSKEILIYVSNVSNYVKVSVTDYGMGITVENQKKIFDRFYRVGEIQERFPGMGIGLYICDQIIKNHGGTLWVESEKGKGSTFSFTIPTTT
ncbi:PAS domain-containing protein [Pedobacter sp. AW1-32]|uniref:PAS domain-containing sensor histidine kinase n=1 Tax=Pedobacter sp. AW1-32 TaxID=3383026 RepID=UPI003FEEB77A